MSSTSRTLPLFPSNRPPSTPPYRPLTCLGRYSNNADAQYNLGLMYYRGDGATQNYAEAVRWYRLAAEQGGAGAQFSLGLMYFSGSEGVPKDDVEAVKWYRLAAEQGDAGGQYFLGLMYDNGYGVPLDNVRAYIWWSVSASQGNEYSKVFREMVSEALTPDQLARGQDIALRCFESGYQDCE